MGRELQKKKNRSSVSKVRQKPKSKKKILNNAIIAANWNQKETLTQNYRRLGLASKLNAPTGGTEKTAAILQENAADEGERTIDTLGIHSKYPKMIDVTEVRIVRDPETGAILQVLDDGEKKPNPLNDPLNDLDSDDDDDEWNGFGENEHGVIKASNPKTNGKTAVVRELEEQAARPKEKVPRKQSDREGQWIEDLVQKHGDDYAAMARDMKLNPMQQSIGDLKKRVKKWQASKA